MTFDPATYDLSGYIRCYAINEDWVSLRHRDYPPESFNPSSTGRYHKPGEPAYYAASGLPTACAEVLGDPKAAVPDQYTVYTIPTGEYRLFDAHRFIEDNPDLRGLLTGPDHREGQVLRGALENMSCSGVVYPSAKQSGGHNAAIWPLDGSALPHGTFFKPRSRPKSES